MAMPEGWSTQNRVEIGLCVLFLAVVGYGVYSVVSYAWPAILAVGAVAGIAYLIGVASTSKPQF